MIFYIIQSNIKLNEILMRTKYVKCTTYIFYLILSESKEHNIISRIMLYNELW